MNEKVAAVPAGSRGLLVLPYFAAAATPRYNPAARGTILGLTFSQTASTLARAFMEGITLDMKDMVSSMVTLGSRDSEARLLGGPTESRVWNQIQADVYGVPVTTLKVTDATVLGAAILGAWGRGCSPPSRPASTRWSGSTSASSRSRQRGDLRAAL